MKHYFRIVFNKIISKESNPFRLSCSAVLGIYLGLGPFLGIQTILAFIFARILQVNFAVVFIVLSLINNPWTMIPIAATGYSCGHWVSQSLLKVDLTHYDPSWMTWINAKIGSHVASYLGIKKLCFWYYFIGGNILAIVAIIFIAPFLYRYALGYFR